MTLTITLRAAEMVDGPRISQLMGDSARSLGRRDYSEKAISAALRTGAWGLDTQLIQDRTFYLVFVGSALAACGGWSFRRTLYGASTAATRNDDQLEPGVDPARIRAFFVHPDYARRGLGSLLLGSCESAAQLAGFRALELAATAGGERLYRAHGYAEHDTFIYDVGDGLTMCGIRMTKCLHRRGTTDLTATGQNSTVVTTLNSTATP